MIHALSKKIQIDISDPVVVAMAPIDEKRWGFYQFVTLSPYFDGTILLRFHAAEDDVTAYGKATLNYLSTDDGKTWAPYSEPDLPANGCIARLDNGEFLCIPSSAPFDYKAAGLEMPRPVGEFFAYMKNQYFLLADCPGEVQQFVTNIPAFRRSADSKSWEKTTVVYDPENAMAWTRAEGETTHLVPRTQLESAPLKIGSELIYADYRQNYLDPEGLAPKSRTVSCMVSHDNAHSFQYRATIAADPTGEFLCGEPILAQNINEDLVCAIRRTHHNQKSMIVTFSKDQGSTWVNEIDLKDTLGDYGVKPGLLMLDCGVMALSYGRPGVHLTFSLDGVGDTWTPPITLRQGTHEHRQEHTDGYTSLLPIGPDSFLLAYSDFKHEDKDGNIRKSINVCQVTVKR
ncbi:hypothetical protein KAH55_01310 [bacterium]|nr:hypothetical protein [bacterium]